MEWIKVILLSVTLVTLAILGMAIQILLKKGGKFPNTHISGSKFLKKQGIYCAQTMDRMEQNNAKKKIDYSSLSISKNK